MIQWWEDYADRDVASPPARWQTVAAIAAAVAGWAWLIVQITFSFLGGRL